MNMVYVHSSCVCAYVLFLPSQAPGELVPEIWVSFVFVKVLLLLLRLTINKHSQIKKKIIGSVDTDDYRNTDSGTGPGTGPGTGVTNV